VIETWSLKMTKFNLSLTDNPYSSRHPLTPDEIRKYEFIFMEMEDNDASIPPKINDDMQNIMKQFLKDNKMSDKQMEYVKDIYDKYSVQW
jgi:hypothetical protein